MRRGIKLLNHDYCHYGMTYKEGLNIDPLPWNPDGGSCASGALYFTTAEFGWKYAANAFFVADVLVLDEYQVVPDDEPATKWKAHALQLSNFRTFNEFLCELSDPVLEYFTVRIARSAESYAAHKPLYRRLLGLGRYWLFTPCWCVFDDLLVALKANRSVLTRISGCKFTDDQLLQLIQVEPASIRFYCPADCTVPGEHVYKKAIELDPGLAIWASHFVK